MELGKFLRKSIPIITLGVGSFIGYQFGHTNNLYEGNNSAEERVREVREVYEAPKEISTIAPNQPRLEGAVKSEKTPNAKENIESRKSVEDLEEKLRSYQEENGKLKNEVAELRERAGLYKPTDANEPVGRNLEERFSTKPSFYLNRLSHRFLDQDGYQGLMDFLNLVEGSLVRTKNTPEAQASEDGSRINKSLLFYDFGTMILDKKLDGSDYIAEIKLKKELTEIEPFGEGVYINFSLNLGEGSKTLRKNQAGINRKKKLRMRVEVTPLAIGTAATTMHLSYLYDSDGQAMVSTQGNKIASHFPEKLKVNETNVVISKLENIMKEMDEVMRD